MNKLGEHYMGSMKKQDERPEPDQQDDKVLSSHSKDNDTETQSKAIEQLSEEFLPEQLQQQLIELQLQLLELKDMLLRARAETENTKRRAAIDIERAHKYGNEKFIKEFISVIDSVEHGLQMKLSNEDTYDGLRLIKKSMLNMLEKFGVEILEPNGDKFNPDRHEAISMQQNNKVEPNTVIEVIQKGFLLHNKVIRAAKVVLSGEIQQA